MLAYFVIAGIAFGIAYWICSTGAASTWRAVVAFVVAHVCGWLGGIATDLLLFSAFIHFDAAATTLSLLGKGFWWSVAGAGYGVYVGRKKLKTTNGAHQSATPKTTHSKPSGNDAYADALAEIEEHRLDKGVWARSFAESGGDESKAKAAYLKTRANAIEADAAWMDTQPQCCDQELTPKSDKYSDIPSGGFEPGQAVRKTAGVSKSGASRTLVWSDVILLVVVGVVGYILYQETTKQQTSGVDQAVKESTSSPELKPFSGPLDAERKPAFSFTPDKDQRSLYDREAMKQQGVGGNQELADVVKWGDAQLSARIINDNASVRKAHEFALMWQRQIISKLQDSPEHALFMGFSVVMNNYDEKKLICRPNMGLHGGVEDLPGDSAKFYTECFTRN